jgi:hypothetical protein
LPEAFQLVLWYEVPEPVVERFVLVMSTSELYCADKVPETVYPVIAEPPLELGAVHEIRADVSPTVATTPVGAPGMVAGVTAPDALEAVPAPRALVAVTVNV